MATVFALILVPALFAVCALLMGIGTASVGSVLAAITFVAVVRGLFVGLYRMAQQMEASVD